MKNVIKFGLILGFLIATLSAGSSVVLAEDKASIPSITGIKTMNLDTDKAEVVIQGDTNFDYKDFKVAKPPMIVIDIANSVFRMASKNLAVSTGVIKNVRSSQFKVKPQNSVRVVIDLKEMSTYSVEKGENQITVKIDQAAMSKAEAAPAPAVEETKAPEVAPAPAPVMEAAAPAPVVDAPVAPAPAAPAPAAEPKEEAAAPATVAKDQSISLDFKEADVRDVLKILSVKSGINMVYGEDVKGEITIHLDKVSFQDALGIILRLTGLTYDYIAPNVMRISTPAKIKEEQNLFVTQTGVFGVNYAKADALMTVLSSLLSTQGKIQVDTRTNSIIVTDIPDNIKKVVDMLKILDVPTPQVMIEAQIVSIDKSAFKDLGVSWNLTKNYTDAGTVPTITNQGKFGTVDTGQVGVSAGFIQVGKVALKGGEWTSLSATLQALETKGKGKVLSSPKIATLNNQSATILSGKKVAYTSSTSQSGGGTTTSSVSFIDVGIKLSVTPSINLDKKITMQIHAEVSSIGNVPAGATVPPPISTRSADTNILAADGETMVIGGLIDEQATEDLSRIPFVGEIPIIGALFTHKTNNTTKTELLVFITPHIM